ncbi:EamA family transporter [Aquincola sp. S2]|uniref:EamA family transporter n=1 Tax=Pseudaquabacterium terrae TaxID=2732868 RepID=A0ABX2EAT9_9BURK|nr:EamA family transporter [Aquabacterium terrae]NRF66219.1 EamA family transporter [Aquabacterium terrae]
MTTTAALYLLTVLIWGTTWIALKLQLGVVPVAWSIAWRFALAALVLLGWLAWRREAKAPPRSAWPLLLAQGLCLFCLNFLCFLHASRWIASGLVAVCFSTAPLWNALNARLFHGQPLQPRVLLGAVLGLAGLTLLFGTDLFTGLGTRETLWGLGLALAGTYCFSLGNLLSGALQRQGLKPLQTNAWAMLAGTAMVSAYALASGQPPAFDVSPVYVGAWLYLAIPGSVIGFTAYLTLVGRLGADRAAYCTVLFPVVALNVSAFFEGYRWTLGGLLGLGLVAAGNVVVFWRGRAVAGERGPVRGRAADAQA